MLRSTHKTIAEKIASELKLSEKGTQLFTSGSLGPDSHGDFPHQIGKYKKILHRIDTARTLFLMNDDECYGMIGNALHYIQDKWTRNTPTEETTLTFDDNLFLQFINQSKMPKKAKENYLQTANSLLTIKEKGIESWFNHSWGIWHKDYSSCIYVFADILELMLPTLQPDPAITTNKENLGTYVRSESFKKSVQEAFIASVRSNFLYPKLAGYPGAMHSLAMISPPSDHCDPKIDVNLVYRLSLEIARHTVSKSQQFKYSDSWTNRNASENKTQMHLFSIVPQYHILIPRRVEEVQKERNMNYADNRREFLANWPSTKESLQASGRYSVTWNTLTAGLVELLKVEKL